MTLDLATATHLEKPALDNGFDQDVGSTGDRLAYGSTHAPLRVWPTADGVGQVAVSLSCLDAVKGLNAPTIAPGGQPADDPKGQVS